MEIMDLEKYIIENKFLIMRIESEDHAYFGKMMAEFFFYIQGIEYYNKCVHSEITFYGIRGVDQAPKLEDFCKNYFSASNDGVVYYFGDKYKYNIDRWTNNKTWLVNRDGKVSYRGKESNMEFIIRKIKLKNMLGY